MPDCGIACHIAAFSITEHAGNQTHAAVDEYLSVAGARDTGGFLPAVLQSVQSQ